MGLHKCPECNLEMSEQEITCPHCGYMLLTKQEATAIIPNQNKQTIITIAKVVAVVMVLWLIYFFCSPRTVAWCCYHNVQAATCTEPEYCLRCGKTWGEATGHHWKEATCTEPMICTTCGEIEVAATGHDWIKATCTEPYTCANCGETDGYEKGHTWESLICTEPKKCAVCGVVKNYIEEHKWKEATCTEPKICNVCDTIDGIALGHNWSEATCEKPKTCKRCKEIEGTALGHDIVNYVCARCGLSKITRNTVSKILNIIDTGSEISHRGPVAINMTFQNKSTTKTIDYITIELEFYSRDEKLLYDDITNETSAILKYTGPLKPGEISASTVWKECFHNAAFRGLVNITEILIGYSDGTTLTLDETYARYAVTDER